MLAPAGMHFKLKSRQASELLTPRKELPGEGMGLRRVNVPQNEPEPTCLADNYSPAHVAVLNHGEAPPTQVGPVRRAVPNEAFRVDDGQVPLHPGLLNGRLASVAKGNQVSLNDLSPALISELSQPELRLLMMTLGGFDTRIRGYDGVAKAPSSRFDRWFKSAMDVNAAAAVALKVWASGDRDTFVRVFAAYPEAVLPFLTGEAVSVLSAEALADVVAGIEQSALPGATPFSSNDLNALGDLLRVYLHGELGQDFNRAPNVVGQLLVAVSRAKLEYSPRNAGIVVGAVIAGLSDSVRQIKASDSRPKIMVDGAVTLQWAAAGVVFGGWGAIASAAVVTAHTVLRTLGSALKLSDEQMERMASRLQGEMQAQWLQRPPEGWTPAQVQEAIAWINTTVLANGLGAR